MINKRNTAIVVTTGLTLGAAYAGYRVGESIQSVTPETFAEAQAHTDAIENDYLTIAEEGSCADNVLHAVYGEHTVDHQSRSQRSFEYAISTACPNTEQSELDRLSTTAANQFARVHDAQLHDEVMRDRMEYDLREKFMATYIGAIVVLISAGGVVAGVKYFEQRGKRRRANAADEIEGLSNSGTDETQQSAQLTSNGEAPNL